MIQQRTTSSEHIFFHRIFFHGTMLSNGNLVIKEIITVNSNSPGKEAIVMQEAIIVKSKPEVCM